MKINELSDEEFMRLMQAARRAQVHKIQERLDRERKDCLCINRAHELARDPSMTTADEQAHLDSCALCRRAISRFRDTSPNAQAAAVNGTASPHVLAFPTPMSLRQYAAKTDSIDVTREIEGGLQWRFVEDGGEFFFRISTQRQELAGKHVAYTMHGAEGTSHSDTLTLQPDAAGYFVAEDVFARDELASLLAGECRDIIVKLQDNGTA